jgi:hypothetical protein
MLSTKKNRPNKPAAKICCSFAMKSPKRGQTVLTCFIIPDLFGKKFADLRLGDWHGFAELLCADYEREKLRIGTPKIFAYFRKRNFQICDWRTKTKNFRARFATWNPG